MSGSRWNEGVVIGWGQRTDGQDDECVGEWTGLDRMNTRVKPADGLRTGVYIEM